MGIGLNYKQELFTKLTTEKVNLDFYELTTEYFFKPNFDKDIKQVLEHYPIVLHGLDLSIGSSTALNKEYLADLEKAIHRTSPVWISDHFAYTNVDDVATHQLMPLQFSKDNEEFIIDKIREINKITNKPFLLENITYYFKFSHNDRSEAEFYNSIFEKTNSGMLLDLNNLFANAYNHNYDAFGFLEQLNLEKIVEIHIAGGDFRSGILIDTHAHDVSNEVWELLEYVLSRTKIKGIVLERDRDFEDIDSIVRDLTKAFEFKSKYM